MLIVCNRSYGTDGKYESSIEVPIGDGTSTIYGTALDAYRVGTTNVSYATLLISSLRSWTTFVS